MNEDKDEDQPPVPASPTPKPAEPEDWSFKGGETPAEDRPGQTNLVEKRED